MYKHCKKKGIKNKSIHYPEKIPISNQQLKISMKKKNKNLCTKPKIHTCVSTKLNL